MSGRMVVTRNGCPDSAHSWEEVTVLLPHLHSAYSGPNLASIPVLTQACGHIGTHISVHIHTYIHTYMYVYMSIYTHSYVCIYICMDIYSLCAIAALLLF